MSVTELGQVIEAVRAAHRVAVACLEGAQDKQYALEEVESLLERIIMLHEIRRQREAAELIEWLGGGCSEPDCSRAASAFSADGMWCANCQPEECAS